MNTVTFSLNSRKDSGCEQLANEFGSLDIYPWKTAMQCSAVQGGRVVNKVSHDHRLADPEPLEAMLRACGGLANGANK